MATILSMCVAVCDGFRYDLIKSLVVIVYGALQPLPWLPIEPHTTLCYCLLAGWLAHRERNSPAAIGFGDWPLPVKLKFDVGKDPSR